MKREELQKKYDTARKRVKKLHDQLEALDHDKNLIRLGKYLGKCYKEVKEYRNAKSVYCVFIYKVEEKNCGLESIRVHYYKDSNGFFHIEHHHFYNTPDDENKNDDYGYKWEEITTKEFLRHYNEVMKRIKLVVNVK